MKKATVIVDSNYLCHRAWHTTGMLSYKDKPVGVIFGFLNQLFTIGKTLQPQNVIFCWDSRKSIRKHKYPFYKSKTLKQREADMSDAFPQFTELRKEILPKLGFPNNFMQPGYEADDLIAKIVRTNASNTSENRTKYIITSSDDDLLQLIDDCIIYNLGKDRIITEDDLLAEYGVTPSQWVEVKKIAGCKSDTVPGVPGVGEITAVKYLTGRLKPESKKYQAIELHGTKELYARKEWLVKLPLPGTKLPNIRQSKFSKKELVKLCDELGFTRLRNDPVKLDDWSFYFGVKERREHV